MIHTAYDVMKEFLITDADLDGKYEIPKIPKTFIHPGKDTRKNWKQTQKL